MRPKPGIAVRSQRSSRGGAARRRSSLTSAPAARERAGLEGRPAYQLPPPPPPPPPPEEPPPNPLELPELGGEAEIALEMPLFMDWRLEDRIAAWNGLLPTYQLLDALVSMPSKALAHLVTQPKTIA